MGLEPTTELVVDINDKNPDLGIEAAKKMLTDNGITDLSDENIFIAAACLDKGIMFLKGEAKVNGVRKGAKSAAAADGDAEGGYTVSVNGKKYGVQIEGNKAVVNGKSYDIDVYRRYRRKRLRFRWRRGQARESSHARSGAQTARCRRRRR